MRPSIYQAIEPNVDGGSTNKCKKIIISMLAGLIDATRDFSSCNSFALCALFILPSTFAIERGT